MTPEQILAIALSRPSNVEQEKLAGELETLDVDDLVSLFRGKEKEAGLGAAAKNLAEAPGKAVREVGRFAHKVRESAPYALDKLHNTNAGKTAKTVATVGAGAYGAKKLHDIDGKMEKKSFSLSREGHNYDADRAAIRGDASAQEAELQQRHRALATKDQRGSVAKALRFTPFEGGDAAMRARHHDYVEKKHREGKNAYNPLGGVFTPSKHERGITSGVRHWGEFDTGRKFTHEDQRPKKEEKSKESAAEEDKKSKRTWKDTAMDVGAVGAGIAGGAYLAHRGIKAHKAEREHTRKAYEAFREHMGNVGRGSHAPSSHPTHAAEKAGKTITMGKGEYKISSVENPDFDSLVALADQWGRELAQEDFEKVSAPSLAAMGTLGKAMGRGAVTGIAGQSVARNAASGALTGGMLGAAKGAIAPGRDQNGNQQSRLGGAARGALGGAAVGGALQAGARAALPHVGSMNNAAGGAVRTALGKGVNEARQTVQQMPQQAGGVMGWARSQLGNSAANAGQMQQKMVSNVKATRVANPGTGAGAKPAPPQG